MDTKLLLRFNELEQAHRPVDAIGNLAELDVEAGLVVPALVDAALGRGRRFVAGAANGYRASDAVNGATLLTRDCSIQVVLNWQLAAQQAYGAPGTIYARGKGTAAAEYVSAALELRVVNAALNVGELRWLWQDLGGVVRMQIGGHFRPHDSEFVLLTATRRWVSSSEVVLRYYLGDFLLSEIVSADGSIGGGTTGTTSIGARYTGAAWERFLDGTIDELRVVDYELSPEEIEGTYRRITVHQPRGYQLIRELHDRGFPISEDAASRVQRETRLWGHGLGYAVAQAENLRNLLPDRSYGEVLERWEEITRQARKPGDSVDTRRARVVSKERHSEGVAIPGVHRVLRELAGTHVANLEVLAFDQTIREPFDTLDPLRWTSTPAASWTSDAGTLRVQAADADYSMNGSQQGWLTCKTSIGGNGRAAHVLSKLVPTALPDQGEMGIFLADLVLGNLVLLGLRNDGGYFVYVETFRGWISQGEAELDDLGLGGPPAVWLHLGQGGTIGFSGGAGIVPFTPRWSTTSQLAGYTQGAAINHPGATQWAGHYVRGDVAGPVDVRFDDTIVRAPCGDRSFHLYVYRDPALAGRPDIVGANHVLRELKQAHTHAAFVTSKQMICDDPTTPCDGGPLGG